MMSAIERRPCTPARGAGVFSARASTLGLVCLTMASQKSTNTRLSWKIMWSNRYSAASPRFVIISAIFGLLIP